MSRIGEDYIWLAKPQRKQPSLRMLGFAIGIPLVVGAVSLANWDQPESSANKARAMISPVSAAEAKASDEVGKFDTDMDVALIPTEVHEIIPPAAPESETTATISTPLPPATDAAAKSNKASRTPAPDWINVKIESGDTLSLAFLRYDLSYRDSLTISHLPNYGSRFTRGLKTGDSFRVKADANGRVLALEFPLDEIRTLELRRDADSFTSNVSEASVEHRVAYAVGTIDTSFYVDALEAGLSDNLIMNLAYIYGWDIDFVQDIRAGDRFIVVYDELYRDGEKIRDGKILAAEFQNQGRALKALRYTNNEGESAYYAPDGRVMKKAFLRVPMDQFRISSHFNLQRKHPILNTIRAHSGTDYAAATGTPIKAAGDGRIAFRGRKGGYGNLIEIRHNNRISTRYGHMSRFRSGLGNGSFVRQGQTIGYVGQSGLATGPHLHYEFRVYGAPKNPETVALPKADPLPKKYMEEFKRKSAPLVAQIEALDRIQVASNSGMQ